MPTWITLPNGPPAELFRSLPSGNVVVLGGPGSGKTALLEAGMQALAGGPAGRGLLLTSSRQAALAATERLLATLERAAGSALGCVTWHAFARGLVTSHADLLPYRGEPRLLSAPEQWSAVRSLLLDSDEVDWGELAPLIHTRAFTDELADFVLACERRLIGPDELLDRARVDGTPATAEARPGDRPPSWQEAAGPRSWQPAAAFLAHYTGQLALQDAIDQAALLVQAGDLLEDRADVLAATVDRVGTVLVDEAQELDPAQLRLLELLAAGGARVVVAGDPAGTIDSYRGATPGALPGYTARLNAGGVLLRHSHRLGGPALDAVRRLQAQRHGPDGSARGGRRDGPAAQDRDPGAAGKDAPGDPAGFGAPRPDDPLVDGIAVELLGERTTTIEVARYPGPADEADAIARLLRVAHQRDGVPYGRMAVLVPTPRRFAGPIRRALERYGIPYRLGAGERQLIAEPVVRQLLDLFRLALDPERAEELLPPLLTSPLGGLDTQELRALRRAALLAERPLAAHVHAPAAELGVPARVAERVRALCGLVEQAGAWGRELEADAAFWRVWQEAPAFARLLRRAAADPADPATGRKLDALTAFSRALALFVDGRPGATMRTYLDVVERADFTGDPWLPPAMARGDTVALLSVNAAKGQEFDLAVVAGCLEGSLPRTAWPEGLFEAWRLDGSADPVARARAQLDAERRRFVLAASRARDRVVFTWSRIDGRGEPSRFLAELGVELPRDTTPPDPTPLGPLEAAGALRRVLTDRDRPAAERLAAAVTIAELPDVDPAGWWWQRDWTADHEPIAAEGRLRTSYSRIGTYEDCHLRYFYGSVAGLDERSSYQMNFGKLMHTIFELAAQGLVDNEPEALKAAYRERFDRSWFPSRAVASQYWNDGMQMLQLWHHGEAAAAREALAFEIPFEIDVAGHVVRGRIDRIDRVEGGIALLDYKTGRTPATEEQAHGSLQLAIYYLAALRDPQLASWGEPVEMQLVYPAKPRAGRFARVSQRPGKDHARRVEQRLVGLLDGAAAELFDPNPHADCRYCPFKALCPLWPQGEDFLAPRHAPAGLDPPDGADPLAPRPLPAGGPP